MLTEGVKVTPSGDLTPPSTLEADPRNDHDSPITLDKPDIERLGRQRPPLLPSVLIEFGFVTTIVLSMMMSEYFISGFNIILPAVASSLNIPETSRTWPAGVTNLTTAALLLPFSRLADMYGARIVFLGGHIWLTAWSLVSGFSQNPIMLIICRAMQGIGASAFLPAGISLLAQTYRPGQRKNFVFSVYGAFACIGFYFGIIIGAVTTELANWRWYFWIGAILTFAVAVSGAITIPRNLHIVDPTLGMDWPGVLTIVPGLVLVVFALTDGGHAPQGWETSYIWVTLVFGCVFLAAGVFTQRTVSKQPMLPAELFRPKYMKRLFSALFCSYGVFGIFLFYSSFYIETVLHVSPILTAAWFTPLCIGGIILAIGGGLILHLVASRVLMLISGCGFLLSVLLFAIIPSGNNNFLYWAYVFPAMVCGTIGVDITFNVTNVYITTAMPRRLQGSASGLINSLLYLGLAFWLGIAEMAVSVARQTKGEENVSLKEQYKIGFWTGVALASLSLCFVVSIKMGRAGADLTADEKAELEEEATKEQVAT